MAFMGRLGRSESLNPAKIPGDKQSLLGRVDFCLGRGTGIRLGCMVYHPAQSQGHIKAVTIARAVQKATHNQRFCLGVITSTVCLQQHLSHSIPPVCTSRIASAVSSL